MINYQHQDNNYPKAVGIAAGIMLLLLALSWFVFIGATTPPQEVGMGGVVVNYGTSEVGMGDDFASIEEPSVAPNANKSTPEKALLEEKTEVKPTTTSSNQEVMTQNNEESVALKTSSKKSTDAPTNATPTKDSKPTVNQNALFKGMSKKTGQGRGDGTGTEPGNQGSKNGDPLAPNYGAGGSGNGGIALDLSNRRFVNLPKVEDNSQSTGYIAVKIKVDKNGKVIEAIAGYRGTTLSNRDLWRKCEQAVLGSSLNKLSSAPDMQVGVVRFKFSVN